MKRVGYFIVTFAEILFLAGVYIIQYFTRRKMGMARYVIYKNQGWERAFPMEALKYTAAAVLTALTLLLLAALVKRRKQLGRLVVAIHFVMLILTAVYGAYTCISSTETMRAYYFISLMLGAAALLQIIKAGAALFMCRKKRDEK
ncbi:hypothetical protein [Lacrimispora indolis]|uniref:hypothetical protein n=1 Tax=Lacrimispora indolis TaxID=69825 RepID=UPI00040994AC|nr:MULTISPECIES: hypothetical protein [Lachnospiraceae]